jgi:hypothetical protein
MWTGIPGGAAGAGWYLGRNWIPIQSCVIGGWFRVALGTAGYEGVLGVSSPSNSFGVSINPNGSLYWQAETPGPTYRAVHFRGSDLALNLGEWYFSLCRWYSSSVIRAQTISQSGVITQGVDTAAQGAFAAPTSWVIGPSFAASSRINIAEVFVLNPDPFGVDGYIPNDLLRQLAYRGPFSIPSVARSVYRYFPLRDGHPQSPINDDTFAKVIVTPPASPHPPVNWVQPQEYTALGMF